MSQRGRPLLLMVALLALFVAGGILVATVAGTAATDIPGSTTADSSMEQADAEETGDWLLTPDDPTNEHYEQAGLDVAGATAVSVQEQTGKFERAVYDEEYRSRGLLPEQSTLTQDTSAQIEQRLEALDERHGQLLEAYSEDEISPTTLFRELNQLHVAAQNQQPLAELVRDNADATGLSLDDRTENLADNLDGELTFLQRPVGDDITAIMTGESDQQLVYIHGASEGVVLAMVNGDSVMREATLRNERDVDAPNQFDDPDSDNAAIGNAFERSQVLYNWVSTIHRVQGYGTTATYVVESDHQYGELIAYLDGGTTNVFHELQELDADEFPLSANVTTVGTETEVTVEATESGGPLRVTALDGESGAPVEGTVTISSESETELAETDVGTTQGGELLTVQPVGPFTVTVTTPTDEEISISIPPES